MEWQDLQPSYCYIAVKCVQDDVLQCTGLKIFVVSPPAANVMRITDVTEQWEIAPPLV